MMISGRNAWKNETSVKDTVAYAGIRRDING